MEEITLYEKIALQIPNRFSPMTGQEKENFYQSINPDYSYIDRTVQTIFCVLKQKEGFGKKDVKARILEYHALYARMVPGFQTGELVMRRENAFNLGILTYKSNAMKRTLFNVLAVMNCDENEILIHMCCNVERAFDELPQFTKILQSVNVAEDAV